MPWGRGGAMKTNWVRCPIGRGLYVKTTVSTPQAIALGCSRKLTGPESFAWGCFLGVALLGVAMPGVALPGVASLGVSVRGERGGWGKIGVGLSLGVYRWQGVPLIVWETRVSSGYHLIHGCLGCGGWVKSFCRVSLARLAPGYARALLPASFPPGPN